MPESEFMKEWKRSFASSFGDVDYSVIDVINKRLNALAEIIDKHLIEIKEDIERSFM